MQNPGENAVLLGRLTPKERDVLDRILDYRTTKDIARDLNVAPNTVDMRLRSAREKLSCDSRKDLARIYGALRQTCGETTCGSSVIAPMDQRRVAPPSEAKAAEFVFRDVSAITMPAPWDTGPSIELPEVLDKRFGKLWRWVAIPAGALAIALIALALLAIANQLGMLV
jgi:DNA-binding CsgD family transcriptional regulator